ncbi:MAG: hypothetical protein RJB38_413 [Pseudomonadota bacterium]|jgi:predicted aminopeptidase
MATAACSTPRGGEIGPSYFIQAAIGQLRISNRARLIDEVLGRPEVSERVKRALKEIPEIKRFAVRVGLRATRNYEEYSDLRRPAAVWVVSACEPLRFEAKRWVFPVVGGFSYLGWFDRDAAESFRQGLESQGYDSDLRPASAYSTLGWFRDPILSTMIPEVDDLGDLAEVVLHESVHATLHLSGQSTLNESLAQFLGEKLTLEYLREKRVGGSEASLQWEETYQKGLAAASRRKELLRSAYRFLKEVYESPRSRDEKSEIKGEVLARLKRDLNWPQARTLNNATLIQFATYESGADVWQSLWESCGKSTTRLLQAIRVGVAGLSKERVTKELEDRELTAFLSSLKTECR